MQATLPPRFVKVGRFENVSQGRGSLTFTQAANPRNLNTSINCTPIEIFRRQQDRAGSRTTNPSIAQIAAPERGRDRASAYSYTQNCDYRPQRRSPERQSLQPTTAAENTSEIAAPTCDNDLRTRCKKSVVPEISTANCRGPVRYTPRGELSPSRSKKRESTDTFVQSCSQEAPRSQRRHMSSNHHLQKTTSFLNHHQLDLDRSALNSARDSGNEHRFENICQHMRDHAMESNRLRQYFSARSKGSAVLC